MPSAVVFHAPWAFCFPEQSSSHQVKPQLPGAVVPGATGVAALDTLVLKRLRGAVPKAVASMLMA